MLNNPWDVGSLLYRKVVIAALLLTGVGIVLVFIGLGTHARPLMYTAMPFIVVGLCAHLAGMVIRSRDARRRLRDSETAARR